MAIVTLTDLAKALPDVFDAPPKKPPKRKPVKKKPRRRKKK